MSTVDLTSVIAEYREKSRRYGLIADVAKRLRLSHEHVRQVAIGARSSPRVARALIAEYRKRQRQDDRQQRSQERAA